jgi:hypothetical protein
MIQGQEDTPTGLMLETMSNEMPMRSLLMSGGLFTQGILEGLLEMINGRLLPGLIAVIRAATQKK